MSQTPDKNSLADLLRDARPDIIGGLVVAAILAIIGSVTALDGWERLVIVGGIVCICCAYVAFGRIPSKQ